jgi:hypothetical protein
MAEEATAPKASEAAEAQGMTENESDLLRLARQDAESVAQAIIADMANHPPHQRVKMARAALQRAFQQGRNHERLVYCPSEPVKDAWDIDVDAMSPAERAALANKLFGPILRPEWIGTPNGRRGY